MSRHRRHILHPVGQTGDRFVTRDPVVIGSVAEAQNVLAGAGPVTFFGDEHAYKAGHDALAAMMPTLAQNNFRVLALELPVEMNGFLNTLQHDIGAHKLGVTEIAKRLNGEFARLRQTVDIEKLMGAFTGADRSALVQVLKKVISQTGGPQRALDWAKLIKAATENHIQVAGIDPRANADFVVKELKQLVEFQKKHGTELSITNFERSLDAAAAANLQHIVAQLPPGARTAVMYGVAHGCLGLQNGGLAQYLTQAGIDVTNIALTSPNYSHEKQESGICPAGSSIKVDAPGFLHDARKHPKPQPAPLGH